MKKKHGGQVRENPIEVDHLKKIIEDAGLSATLIEVGINMPKDTLRKALSKEPDSRGYVRKVPAKWVPVILKYIKKKKLENIELKEEIKEVLKEHDITLPKTKTSIPDEERKMLWFNKLHECVKED